jgi:hypothetical protein
LERDTVRHLFVYILHSKPILDLGTEIISSCALNITEKLMCDQAPDRCVDDINSERTITTCCCSTDNCNQNNYKTGVNIVPISHDETNTVECFRRAYLRQIDGTNTVEIPSGYCKAKKWCRTVTYVELGSNSKGV